MSAFSLAAMKQFATRWTQQSKPAVIHLHGHQPGREVKQSRKPHTLSCKPMPEKSAPDRSVNWTQEIYFQSYQLLLELGNVYRQVSFNFTPVLLEQLQVFDPAFIDALKEVRPGNALASGFHHTIFPLASRADKEIQTAWGIEHFKRTFGHSPQGFWLPELAVDQESLEVLKSFGIEFVVLSPDSAASVAAPAVKNNWRVVGRDKGFPTINHGVPRYVRLENDQRMKVVFYDPWLAHELGFNSILNQPAENLLNRVKARLQHHLFNGVAVDMETFGHHKEWGAHTLAGFLKDAQKYGIEPTNFSVILDIARQYPWLFTEVKLHNSSAWSCAHGVGRWMDNCGCEGNDNHWRAPLRAAVDDLAKQYDRIFEAETKGKLKDPHQAKLNYIDVLLGKSEFKDFIQAQALGGKQIDIDRLSHLFNALLPRQAMYTSCGWFFGGMRIEAGYNLASAWELITTVEKLGVHLEPEFKGKLGSINNTARAMEEESIANAAELYNLVVTEQTAALL